MAGTEAWFWIVGLAGLTTLLLGAYFAIFQQDLKGLLAYSTISHLGLITVLLSLGSPLAAVAAVFHIVNHATFKASLFMAAGIIDHETGTRDMRKLGGLIRYMPGTAMLAMVASAAMAGVPLLNGFISKEMFFAEAIETHQANLLDTMTPYVATLAGMFAVTYSLRFIHSVFFGPTPSDLPKIPHEPPRWMRAPIEFLVLACLVVGIIPAITIGPFLHTAVVSILGASTPAVQPFGLARLEPAADNELRGASRWHRPLFPDAELSGDQHRRAAGLPPAARPAHLRAGTGDPVVEVGALARTEARHAPAAAADAVPGLRRDRRRRPAAAAQSFRTAAASGARHRSGLRPALGDRHRLRGWGRLPGKVPPAGGTRASRRRRSRHLHHLRLAVGPRSCGYPAPRRDRHDCADPARPALAAQAHRGHAGIRIAVAARPSAGACATFCWPLSQAAAWR